MKADSSNYSPHLRKLAGTGAALLLGLFLSSCLVIGLEISLRHGYGIGLINSLRPTQPQMPREESRDFMREEAIPSYVRDPFAKIRDKLSRAGDLGLIQTRYEKISPESYRMVKQTTQGDLLYDVTYRFRDGRRITPGQPSHSSFSVIVMGCSFTLGEGLDEDQTLTAFLQRFLKNATVHNAASHGWGPADLLLSVRKSDPKQWPSPLKVIPKAPKTIGIFVLTEHHFNRIVCDLDCHETGNEWIRDRPDFQPNERGELVYLGRMSETHTFPFWLRLLADSAIARSFGLSRMNSFSRPRQEKMAKILTSLRDELAAKTELEDFYLLHHPQGEWHDFTHLHDALRASGIKVLEPDPMHLGYADGRLLIPLDAHPSPRMNFLLANYISTKLKMNEPELKVEKR
jgi:hypothetical protein